MSQISLKNLHFEAVNPLVESKKIQIKQRAVRTGSATSLIDTETGEMSHVSVIHQFEEKDDEHFVKIFAAGVAAAFELNRTSARVFQAILQIYENTPLTNGYADCVYLAWFGEGLAGESVGMSEKTFQRGLKDLLVKGFLAPKSPNVFWINPSLFFKGDRVRFVKEYRRASTSPKIADNNGS